MLFAQPIKARLNLVNVARAISCKDILEWGYVYLLSANTTAGDYMELPFTWSILRDQHRTEYPNKSVSRRSQSVSIKLSPLCSTPWQWTKRWWIYSCSVIFPFCFS